MIFFSSQVTLASKEAPQKLFDVSNTDELTNENLTQLRSAASQLSPFESLIDDLNVDEFTNEKLTQLLSPASQLLQLENLSFNLSNSSVTDQDLKIFSQYVQVYKIETWANEPWSIEVCRYYRFDRLKSLDLNLSNTQITDEGVAALTVLPQLKNLNLNLSGTQITYEKALLGFSPSTVLNYKLQNVNLNLRGTLITNQGLNELILKLSYFRQVEHLTLSLRETQVTYDGLRGLGWLHALASLNLDVSGIQLYEGSLVTLLDLFQLTSLTLNLSGTQAPDEILTQLPLRAKSARPFPHLTNLNLDLSDTQITVHNVVALVHPLSSQLESLTLSLSGAQVTNKSLEALTQLSQLKSLNLYLHNTSVTNEGVKRLHQAGLKLQISGI